MESKNEEIEQRDSTTWIHLDVHLNNFFTSSARKHCLCSTPSLIIQLQACIHKNKKLFRGQCPSAEYKGLKQLFLGRLNYINK